jgi:UDP-N-acetylmuramyl pentapeptide synthase
VTELTLTLDWVAAAVGATRRKGSVDAAVGEVVTDSRTLQPGDLFVALRWWSDRRTGSSAGGRQDD